MLIQHGATDRSVEVLILDATTGAKKNDVVFNSAGIALWYRRDGAAQVAITEATLSALTDAHADGGFLLIGDGVYRLDLPDAAFASGARRVTWGGAVTGGVIEGGATQLVPWNPDDAVRLGMTALPNANADAAGGLAISDAGGLDLDTLLGILQRTEVWQGTLSAIAAGSVTFPGGHGIDPNATIQIVLTGGTAAKGRARFLTYSGAGDVWTPDPAWNVGGQPVPSGAVTAVVYAVAANAAADLAALADAVWDELLAGHAGVGSAGAGLSAAGSAGDPWSSTTFGAAGAGTAGERLARIPNAAAGGAGGLPTVDGTNRVGGLMSAAQVRTELAVELARVDAAITSRAAPGAAMTLTSGERTAVANEVETQIIDETDAEKVLLAITNKIAEANPDLSGLTLGAIGAAVRTALNTELLRIDVAISTRLATAGYTAPPTAGQNATQVRTELGVELARVDVATSTRAAPGAAMTLTSGERTSIGAAVMATVYEGARSLQGFLRLASSALWSKSSGHAAGASSPVYRDQGDTKARITATTDANGNRTAVTVDDV